MYICVRFIAIHIPKLECFWKVYFLVWAVTPWLGFIRIADDWHIHILPTFLTIALLITNPIQLLIIKFIIKVLTLILLNLTCVYLQIILYRKILISLLTKFNSLQVIPIRVLTHNFCWQLVLNDWQQLLIELHQRI